MTYSLDEGRTRFFDLLQMVEFYQLNRGTLSHRLTHYVISKEAALALGYDITKKPAQKPSPPPPVPTNPEPSSPELPKTTTSQSQKVRYYKNSLALLPNHLLLLTKVKNSREGTDYCLVQYGWNLNFKHVLAALVDLLAKAKDPFECETISHQFQ